MLIRVTLLQCCKVNNSPCESSLCGWLHIGHAFMNDKNKVYDYCQSLQKKPTLQRIDDRSSWLWWNVHRSKCCNVGPRLELDPYGPTTLGYYVLTRVSLSSAGMLSGRSNAPHTLTLSSTLLLLLYLLSWIFHHCLASPPEGGRSFSPRSRSVSISETKCRVQNYIHVMSSS